MDMDTALVLAKGPNSTPAAPDLTVVNLAAPDLTAAPGLTRLTAIEAVSAEEILDLEAEPFLVEEVLIGKPTCLISPNSHQYITAES